MKRGIAVVMLTLPENGPEEKRSNHRVQPTPFEAITDHMAMEQKDHKRIAVAQRKLIKDLQRKIDQKVHHANLVQQQQQNRKEEAKRAAREEKSCLEEEQAQRLNQALLASSKSFQMEQQRNVQQLKGCRNTLHQQLIDLDD